MAATVESDMTVVFPTEALTRERVCKVVEDLVLSSEWGQMSLLDVLSLCQERMEGVFGTVKGLDEQSQLLRRSIWTSSKVEVKGPDVVLRTPDDDQAWWAWQSSSDGAAAMASEDGVFDPSLWALLHDGSDGTFADSANAWWAAGTAGSKQSDGLQYCSTRTWNPITRLVLRLLERPSDRVKELMRGDGSLSMADLVNQLPVFATPSLQGVDNNMKALRLQAHPAIILDQARAAVRLAPEEQLLALACEDRLRRKQAESLGAPASAEVVSMGLAELAADDRVAELLARGKAGEEDAWIKRLVQAIEGSGVLVVLADGTAAMRPITELLLGDIELVLKEMPRALGFWESEGEVPLQFVLEMPSIAKAWQRFSFSAPCGATLMSSVKASISCSSLFKLSSAGMTIERVATRAPPGFEAIQPERADHSSAGAKSSKGSWPKSRRILPTESDAKDLKRLLTFYFEPFNLQHNRVLLAVAQKAHWMVPQEDLVFRIDDIASLPRVAKLFARYDPEALPMLLAAALACDEGGTLDQLVRVRKQGGRGRGGARGSWAQPEPELELAYTPDLRLLEAADATRPGVEALASPGPNADRPLENLPSEAVCVVSYSVSSDLSNGCSKKAAKACAAALSAGLDLRVLDWEYRQPRLVRQLLLHGPDVMCLQGLQAVGFEERCSEDGDEWCTDSASTLDHLAHLYREVSCQNYAVLFVPSVVLPSSGGECLGCAVLWKRSRFTLRGKHQLRGAACVELASRRGGPPLLVCSSKPEDAMLSEWTGSCADVGVLAEAAEALRQDLGSLAQRLPAEVHSIWCGDPGAAPASAEAPAAWRSACSAVASGGDWSGAGEVASRDFVLHQAGLEVAATLGDFSIAPGLAGLLRRGYPSDHMLQLALFVAGAPAAGGKGDGDAVDVPGWLRPTMGAACGAAVDVETPATMTPPPGLSPPDLMTPSVVSPASPLDFSGGDSETACGDSDVKYISQHRAAPLVEAPRGAGAVKKVGLTRFQ